MLTLKPKVIAVYFYGVHCLSIAKTSVSNEMIIVNFRVHSRFEPMMLFSNNSTCTLQIWTICYELHQKRHTKLRQIK